MRISDWSSDVCSSDLDVSGLRDGVEPAFCRRNPARDETLLDEAIFLDLDAVGFDGVFQFAKISHDWSPLPPRSTKRVIVVGIALFDEARVVGESGDVVLGEITQHRVHALLQLVQAGAEMEACGLACSFEDLVTMLQGNVNVALNKLRQMAVAHLKRKNV